MVSSSIPSLPRRPAEGHKGTFGTVVVAAGSVGMAGAAGLCARAVLRSGAGLCQIACPEEVQPQIAVLAPGATTLAQPCKNGRFSPAAAKPVLVASHAAGTLALGPGIGQGQELIEFVSQIVTQTKVPTVVDADGLNALAQKAMKPLSREKEAGPLILTPHPGEAARLLGITTGCIQQDRIGSAKKLAEWSGGVCLLKGAGTVVTDGSEVYVNKSGNSGMATGGAGDVLTGIVAALLAQGCDPYPAACLGAWLHGRAGDLGSRLLTPWCFTAEDLLCFLPEAFCEAVGMESA